MHNEHTPGLLRFLLGLLLVFGAAGGLDDPAAPVFTLLATAAVGLALMYWATVAMNRSVDQSLDSMRLRRQRTTRDCT